MHGVDKLGEQIKMPLRAQFLKEKSDFNSNDVEAREPVSAVRTVRLVASVQEQSTELLQKEEFCCSIATD